MRTPGFSERIANVAGHDRCRWCCDQGWVVVWIRTDHHIHRYFTKGDPVLQSSTGQFDEMGPCPMCQRGYFEEFGDAEHQTRAPGIKPPWGPEGFWASQDNVDLVPLEDATPLPLPRPENARRMRELLARMADATKEAAA